MCSGVKLGLAAGQVGGDAADIGAALGAVAGWAMMTGEAVEGPAGPARGDIWCTINEPTAIDLVAYVAELDVVGVLLHCAPR